MKKLLLPLFLGITLTTSPACGYEFSTKQNTPSITTIATLITSIFICICIIDAILDETPTVTNNVVLIVCPATKEEPTKAIKPKRCRRCGSAKKQTK